MEVWDSVAGSLKLLDFKGMLGEGRKYGERREQTTKGYGYPIYVFPLEKEILKTF